MADLKYSDLKIQMSGDKILYITVTDKVNGASTGKPQNFYDICKVISKYDGTKLRSFAKAVAMINGLNVPKDSNGNNLYSKVDTEIGMRIYTASNDDLNSLSSSNAVTITKFGKTDEDGRELFATWSWGKGSETEKYEYVWSYGVGLGVWFIGSEGSTENKQCTYSPPEEANKVKFVVKPVCKDSSSSGSSTKKKWIGVWSVEQIYDYRNDPPNTPDKESINASIDDKLTFKINMSIADIGQTGINTRYGNSLGHIQFRILQYDSNEIIPTATIYKTVTYPIVKNQDETYSSSGYLEKVPAGYNYAIICRSVKGVNASDYRYSEWSEPTEDISARPGRITDSEFVSVTAMSPTSVRLVWKKKRSASKYQIRYTTNRFAFDGYPDISSVEVTGSPFGSDDLLFTILTGIDPGFEWFFEIRPSGEDLETPWSNYKSVYLGVRPDPPTTWSSSSSAVIDDPNDPLTLYWIHNTKDGSLESSADIELMYNDEESTTDLITVEKTSDPVEQNATSSFIIDSSRFDELGISPVENIKWRVRTEGISKRSDTEYVTEENDEQYITDFLDVANSYYETFVNGDDHTVEYGYPSYESYKYPTMLNKEYYSKCLKDPKDSDVDINLTSEDREKYFGLINVMDCSVFGTLCLMGIPAEETPYAHFVEVDDSDIFNECEKVSGNMWAFVNVDKINDKYYISKDSIGRYSKITPSLYGITESNMFGNPIMSGNKYVRTQLYERGSLSSSYADSIDKTTHAVYKRVSGSDTIYYSLVNLSDNEDHDGVLEIIGYETKEDTITGSIIHRVDKSKIFAAGILYYPSDLDSDRFEKIRAVYEEQKASNPWAVDILDMNSNRKPTAADLCEMLENAGRLVQFSINESDFPASNLTNVRKGDILFFAANPSVEKRYKAVSHISIVTEITDYDDPYNTLQFIEVTNFGTVVRKGYLKDRNYYENYYEKTGAIPAAKFLVSICRPILNRDARYLYENGSYKSDWSVQRSIDLYSKPTVNVSITSEDDPLVVTKYPIVLSAEASPSEQNIIGLSIDIMSKDSYDYEDEFGITRYVKENDTVYSKYFNRSDTFYNEYSQQDVPYITDNEFYYLLQPNEIDLQTNKDYILKCEVVMNSGLKASSEIEFKALFEETEVYPDASVEIDDKNLVIYIAPWCGIPDERPKSVTYEASTGTYIEGSYLDTVPEGEPYVEIVRVTQEGEHEEITMDVTHFTGSETDPEESRKKVYKTESDDFYCFERYMKDVTENYVLSVYRRELDGTFTLIADNISSGSGYYVIDPHPSLQNASYRIIATSKTTDSTAAVNTGYLDLRERSLVIQWDEKITDGAIFADRFEDTESTPWGGKILKLPYNIDISESASRDIDKIEYSGRKHPVTYYGTQTGESMSINLDIDKSDTNTINLLRELSIYQGDVYVREPSGVGYWASVNVSFSRNHLNLVVPVSFDITRVEGGM